MVLIGCQIQYKLLKQYLRRLQIQYTILIRFFQPSLLMLETSKSGNVQGRVVFSQKLHQISHNFISGSFLRSVHALTSRTHHFNPLLPSLAHEKMPSQALTGYFHRDLADDWYWTQKQISCLLSEEWIIPIHGVTDSCTAYRAAWCYPLAVLAIRPYFD